MKQSVQTLLLLFCFHFLCMHLKAQGSEERIPYLVISGINVQDAYTRSRLVDAKVQIFKSDSVTLLTDDVSYSKIVNFGKVSYSDGTASFSYCQDIVVKVSMDGYNPAVLAIHIPENQVEHWKNGNCGWGKFPKILLSRCIATKQLGEAQVTTSRLLMVVKGDTLEYNVANMQMSAGSMLDNLIRSLPGAQLDHNGRITINGEFVERMLVNGRQFFHGDPLVALKNLPYYTVSKIKVYHDVGGSFRSESDSLKALARANLTMDVRLKRIYSEAWLANVELGSGTRTHTDWDPVYFGRFFAMRFTDHSSLGIYGLTNNVGKNYSATHNGNWREMQAADGGEPVTRSAGIDFSVDGKKTLLKFETSLNVSQTTNDVETRTSAQNFLETGDLYARSRSQSHSKSFRASWSASLQRLGQTVDFSFRPSVIYDRSHDRAESQSALFSEDPLEQGRTASLDSLWGVNSSERLEALLINDTRSLSQVKRDWLNTSAGVGIGIKMPHTNNRLRFSIDGQYVRSTYGQIDFTSVRSKVKTYNDNLYSTSPRHRFSYKAGVNYPIFHIAGKNGFSVSSNLGYTFEHRYDHAERALYKDDGDMPSTLPDMNTGLAWEYNLRNSYLTHQYEDNHLANWSLMLNIPGFRKGHTVDLTVEVPFHADGRKVEDERNRQNRQLRKTYCYFSPNVRVMALNYELSGGYSLKPFVPFMNQMLDITDDAFSLYRTEGNPYLKMQFTHELQLAWNRRMKEKAKWIGLSWEHSIVENKQTYGRTFDRETGVTTSKSMNIGGNWWTTGKASYGQAFDKAKHFNLALSAFYTYAHSVDYSGDTQRETPQRYTVHNNRAGGNASISYSRKEQRVSLQGNVSWTGLKSPVAGFRNMSYTDMYYTLSFATPLIWGIDFDTDLKLNLRRGYHEPSMNTTEWVWNAALSTKLGRGGQWVVRAVAFDILHNLSNVRNTIDAQGHTEVWNNCVQSYVSLHVVYHFKVKPSKKGIGSAT